MRPDQAWFCCAAEDAKDLRYAVALGESLRAFGGELAESHFAVYCLPGLASPVTTLAPRFAAARISHQIIDPGQVVPGLPFAVKTAAAGAAEAAAAQGGAGLLVWLDAGSLILRRPLDLRLPSGAVFGYRPVDHTLVGSRICSPADGFWQAIYDRCSVPAAHLVPMTTTVDRQVLRPYFNAGLMVVRPEAGLLQAWIRGFSRLREDDAFQPYLEQRIYRVFFHQAVLAGTVMAMVSPQGMHLLPATVSYPLHMHADYPLEGRAQTLEQLVTVRHEGLLAQPGWRERLGIPAGAQLARWIDDHLGAD